jgi:hypothetical protein
MYCTGSAFTGETTTGEDGGIGCTLEGAPGMDAWGAAPTRWPQLKQNWALGGSSVEQFRQRRASAVPQFMQNLAPLGLSVVHVAQIT